MNKFHHLIATIFGLGKLPFGPGTFGSLAALPFCLFLHNFHAAYIAVFLVLFALGVVSSSVVAQKSGEKDPRFVVIDEFACMFVVFMFLPVNFLIVLAGFILYRVLDILKPMPISQIERLGGGWGIMLDDLAAAVFTNLILQLIIRLFV